MRLLDSVAQCSAPVRIECPGGERIELPGASARSHAVAEAPLRYVLADDVRDQAIGLIERWPNLLDPVDFQLRVPSERVWLEWSQPLPPEMAGVAPQRCGILVTTERNGRAGRIESFWQDPAFGAERAQVHVEFDLDAPLAHHADGVGRLAMAWSDPHVPQLLGHALACVDPAWLAYFERACADRASLRATIAECVAAIDAELPFLLAFCRLLAIRGIDERKVERGPLNAARSKRGKPALLDHVEALMKIGAETHLERRGGADRGRAAARLHLVRGHLVHRRGSLFWRTAHLRGDRHLPPVVTRTVRVSAKR